MKLTPDMPDPKQAVELQNILREKIILEGFSRIPAIIGGTDISYDKRSDTLFAGIVILKLPELHVIDSAYFTGKVTFPYIPGLLSFREVPALFEAYQRLKIKPELLMVDGQGYAHPRRIGLASHLGLVLNIPTIGVAKKKLIGTYEEPPLTKGSYSPLYDNGEMIGYVLRTKDNTRPVFVSPGHLINFEWSLKITLHTLKGYKIPEPTRQAHIFVNQIRKKYLEET